MKKISKILFSLSIILSSCQKKDQALFRLIEAQDSGIDFVNEIKPTADLNIFNYMYYYNGGGVGAADLNLDGLIDLVFTSNLGDSKIYLNKGNLKFEEVTKQSNFTEGFGWSNGVSIVDINQDGLLDIYVSQVGDYESLQSHNLLFLCKEIKNGIPIYEEKSGEYGLDLVGFGTQAVFADFDADGDLDFFQLNHSVHKNGTFGKRDVFLGTFHTLAGDRYFKNENGKYIEITKESGIHSNALGYGLGIVAGDLNFDGYPDLYIGNDFHENDYLYINQKNGFFKDEIQEQIRHTSRFSMGVDIADLNNDLFPEIISLDMLPYNPEILKRSEGEDAYYNFKFKLQQGYNYQFARNNLQLNNGNNTFSEIGIFSNIHATDWSWSALFFDFENDGKKDLFISNGINKRMNDMDYINFVSNDDIQRKIEEKKFNEQDESLVDLLPEVKIPNKFFRNTGDIQFEEIGKYLEKNPDSYSNGAIYADLDNDGDLDIVTNNINDPAFLYENLSNEIQPKNKSLTLTLKGSPQNKNAIGAKILIFKNKEVKSFEKFPVRGFQSSMEIPLTIGLGPQPQIDSMLIVWPNHRFQKIEYDSTKKVLDIEYSENLPVFNFEKYLSASVQEVNYKEISEAVGLDFRHVENAFNEFDREALIPNQMATEGPALAIKDINNDGLEDIFIGSSRGHSSKIYVQNTTGKFQLLEQDALEKDKEYEEIDAVWVDVNKDSFPDLVVASGGNEFFGKSEYLRPRIYLNDGTGKLKKLESAFENIFINASRVIVLDQNKDGFPDLFFAARSVPFGYGKRPDSYIFINDKKGNYVDKTSTIAPDLRKLGLVTDAVLATLDINIGPELILALEWGEVIAFDSNFKKRLLCTEKGLWNTVFPVDIDGDGDLDLILGNLGLNSRFKGSKEEPLKMYVNDFDQNGRVEQIITYYIEGKETIFADKREIERQLPYIKKKYTYSKDFSLASLSDIFGKDLIKSAEVFEANYFQNAILVNEGNGKFNLKAMPKSMQYSPIYTVLPLQKNSFIFGSNFFDCNIQLGQYDADIGGIYEFDSKLNVNKKLFKNYNIKGQVRQTKKLRIGERETIVVVQNNDQILVLQNQKE
jgi:hypothetical protein